MPVYATWDSLRRRLGDYGDEISGAAWDDRANTVPHDLSAYADVRLELSSPGIVLFSESVIVNQSTTNRFGFVVPDRLFTQDGIYRIALTLHGINSVITTEFEEYNVHL